MDSSLPGPPDAPITAKKLVETEGTEAALAEFGAWCLKEARGDGYAGDIDGGSVQSKALELGLLIEREVTEPCSEVSCVCAEAGDFPATCLFLAPGIE